MSGKGCPLIDVRVFRDPAVGTRRHVTFDGILMSDADSKSPFSQNVDHYERPWSVVRNMSQLLCSQETIISFDYDAVKWVYRLEKSSLLF